MSKDMQRTSEAKHAPNCGYGMLEDSDWQDCNCPVFAHLRTKEAKGDECDGCTEKYNDRCCKEQRPNEAKTSGASGSSVSDELRHTTTTPTRGPEEVGSFGTQRTDSAKACEPTRCEHDVEEQWRAAVEAAAKVVDDYHAELDNRGADHDEFDLSEAASRIRKLTNRGIPRTEPPSIDYAALRKSAWDALVERNIVLEKENAELRQRTEPPKVDQSIPIPIVLHCPHCHKQHIDEGIWATKPHRTHQCVDDVMGKGCGKGWTPSAHRTVGVHYKDLKFDVLEEPSCETVGTFTL